MRVIRAASSLWRLVLFALLLTASIIVGLAWHEEARTPDAADPSRLAIPFSTAVYAEDQSVPITIEVDVQRDGNGVRADDCGCGGDGVARAYVYVERQRPTDVLFASSVELDNSIDALLPASAGKTFAAKDWAHTYLSYWPASVGSDDDEGGGGPTLGTGPYAAIRPGSTVQVRAVGYFDLPDAYYRDRGDVAAARFPMVSEGLGNVPWVPDYGTNVVLKAADPNALTAFDASSVRAVGGYASALTPASSTPAASPSESPTSPATFADFKGKIFTHEVFWEPTSLSVTDRLVDATSLLDSRESVVNTPVQAVPDGSDLVWRGTSGLGAQFSAENRARIDAAGRNEFLSGVALATAAAALIALVQEIPRRRRNVAVAAEAASSSAPTATATSKTSGSWAVGVTALAVVLALLRFRRPKGNSK